MKIVAVLALAIFAVASANDNCNRECSLIIAPVCGYDPKTKSFKTFDNVCYLGQENCLKKTSYYKRFEGSCVQPRAQAAAAEPVNQDQSEVEEENNSECPLSCPLIWGPVCGYDEKTGKYKTFANDCKLRSTNCRKQTSYVEKSKGNCAQPRAEVEAAQPSNQDESEEQSNDCPIFCPQILLPVCGYDDNTETYKTFDNSCELESRNCLIGTSYVEISKGACSDDE